MNAKEKGAFAGRLFGALVGAFFSRAPLALAAGLSLGGNGSNSPVEIRAQSGIEWQQKAQVYIARGHAVAKRGESELKADTLTAYYRSVKKAPGEGQNPPPQGAGKGGGKGGAEGLIAGSNAEIYRIDADGHVVIKSPTRTVVGDHAVYDLDRGIAVITGKNLRMTTPQEVVSARKSLEWYARKEIAVARGDAVAIRRDRRIRADVLTAYFVKAGKGEEKAGAKGAAKSAGAGAIEGGEKIARIDAEGHVLVSTPTDIARSDYAVYDARKDFVTLLHHVTITRGRDTIRGGYAVIDLKRNISRIMNFKEPGKRPEIEALVIPRQKASPEPVAKTGAKPR